MKIENSLLEASPIVSDEQKAPYRHTILSMAEHLHTLVMWNKVLTTDYNIAAKALNKGKCFDDIILAADCNDFLQVMLHYAACG